jgi:hypothetical protein
MTGVFWNSRGLADLAKHRRIAEWVKEERLDFIAIFETRKDDFPSHLLKSFCVGADFLWSWVSPQGQSGGILLGVNLAVFYVRYIDLGDFYLKFHLRNKDDGFQWALIAVYGAAQEEHKDRFLTELVNACGKESLPLLVGGDFNIIRR